MPSSSKSDQATKLFEQSREADKRGDLPEAMRLIDQAIELDSSDTVLWSAKAQYLNETGAHSDAISAGLRAIEINPKNWHALATVGLAYAKLKNYVEAVSYYKKSVALHEQVGTYTLLAGAECQLDVDDVDSAIEHAKRALEIDPNWEEAASILKSAKAIRDEGASTSGHDD